MNKYKKDNLIFIKLKKKQEIITADHLRFNYNNKITHINRIKQ